MIDEKPCPFCGDDSEYFRFLDLCAERANEIWRENEVKVMTGVYNSMNFIEVVRCRDCKHYDRMNDDEGMCMVLDDDGDYARWMVDDVGYCYLGERRGE